MLAISQGLTRKLLISSVVIGGAVFVGLILSIYYGIHEGERLYAAWLVSGVPEERRQEALQKLQSEIRVRMVAIPQNQAGHFFMSFSDLPTNYDLGLYDFGWNDQRFSISILIGHGNAESFSNDRVYDLAVKIFSETHPALRLVDASRRLCSYSGTGLFIQDGHLYSCGIDFVYDKH